MNVLYGKSITNNIPHSASLRIKSVLSSYINTSITMKAEQTPAPDKDW